MRETRVWRQEERGIIEEGVGPKVEVSEIEKVKGGGEACEEWMMSLSSDSASVSTSSALAKHRYNQVMTYCISSRWSLAPNLGVLCVVWCGVVCVVVLL